MLFFVDSYHASPSARTIPSNFSIGIFSEWIVVLARHTAEANPNTLLSSRALRIHRGVQTVRLVKYNKT